MNLNHFPNPWDLRYFQEIATTGNLSRAADRLGVSQPTLSQALKRLEDDLQTQLFVRRSRGLCLTPAGRIVLRESNHLLEQWALIMSQAKSSETEVKGYYSFGCHPSVAIYALKEPLKQLYSNYPGLEIQLIHGLSRVICEGVISAKIDFGLVVNPIRHPELVIHKFAKDEVAFWKASKCIEDVLIYNPDLLQAQSLLKKIQQSSIFTRAITSDNLEVISTLCAAGVGVGLLPSRVARVFSPNLKRITSLPVFQDQICFIYRSDLTKTASARCIIDQFKSLSLD